MNTPLKLLQQVKRRVQAVTYGSPVYRMMLDQGPMPDRLRLTIPDLWPGDANAGQALISTQPGLFEHENTNHPNKIKHLIAHEWLRDLRAVGTEKARRKAQDLLVDWLHNQDQWQEDSWHPAMLGERLGNWIGFYDFYSPDTTKAFTDALIVSMVRQLRHLLRNMPTTLTGIDGLRAIKGLIYGGLGLIDGEKSLSLALEFLQRQLVAEILPDGGHISRNPSLQLHMLRYLIDIRGALRTARIEVPHELNSCIERMIPALKFYRHGDNGLALFNGSHEESALWIDAVITQSEARGRVPRRLAHTGYERVVAGRSMLLVDVAPPPPRPYDTASHAGLLGFEFSIGRERLIVNCGAGPEDDVDWRMATAATAAHSTLTLADTNACEIIPYGGIHHRPDQMGAQRYEQDGVHYMEMMHNGYAQKFHVTYHRTLGIDVDGEALRGREVLSGPAGEDFTIRWHLHPSVQASLAQGGQAALLRTTSGSGWRLRVEGGDLGLEPSIYCGGTSPRRTLQLKVTSRMITDPTVVSWILAREKKG